MADRYFVDEPIVGAQATLAGAEAHHLAHVMRGKPGDEVTLFDGSGAEFGARVRAVGRSSIELAIVERREVDRELPFMLVLGVALPKGDRQKWLVEKLTELGVTRLVPLETERGVAQPVEGAMARLGRAVIEAAKQCGRNRLMELAARMDVEKFLAAAPVTARRWFAHPLDGKGPGAMVGQRETWIAVGPEGGFTDKEREAAERHGWTLVDLGPRVLRVETGAVALASLAALGSH